MKRSIRTSLESYCDELEYGLEDAVILNKKFGVKEKYQIAFLKVRDYLNNSDNEFNLIACTIDGQNNIRDLPNVKWETDYSKTIFDKTTSGRTQDGRFVGIPLQVSGHCSFPNGLELSIISREKGNKKAMEIFACSKDEKIAQKLGSKTLEEIENEQER